MLREHLATRRQMAFVAGPRQVGKTTACRKLATHYLDWDEVGDRRLILRGPGPVAGALGLAKLAEKPPVIVFDEIHKHRGWRQFLKGFFDKHGDQARVVVTGSSRLDVYRRGGDSLMGRYFPYRMHPLTIGELLRPELPAQAAPAPPQALDAARLSALFEHGGFPEPYLKAESRFSRRRRRLRLEQLVRGDIRDLTRIQEIDRVEARATLLASQSASELNYSSLARDLDASVDSIRRWIAALCALYHGFRLRPWFNNVKKSLRKEPRWYLQDWSTVSDPGCRAETLVACHLQKAVHLWHDLGFGDLGLYYLRDKQGREVNFVVGRHLARG